MIQHRALIGEPDLDGILRVRELSETGVSVEHRVFLDHRARVLSAWRQLQTERIVAREAYLLPNPSAEPRRLLKKA